MRKLFALAAITACALPALAFAAYNDVTLTTDAVISVGGYTLDVSGSSATIQSITVNTTNFSVTLASGSAVTISSPTLQQLSSDVTSDVTNNTCTGSASSISLAYSGGGTVTNVITPSATVCITTSSSSGGSGGGGGGGGGQIVGSSPTAPGYLNTNPTGTSPALAIRSTTAASTSLPAAPTKAVSSTPATTSHAVPSTSSSPFLINHELWDQGPDILALQQWLNAHGFPLVSSGWGSPGNETDTFGLYTYAALIKFQEAHGLPATGFFGPLTRAAIANMSITTTQ